MLIHEQVHKGEFLETRHRVYDYELGFESFQGPYIPKFHKMYFYIDWNLFKHTSQNRISLLYFLLLSIYSQVLYLCESILVCAKNKFQSILEWKNRMLCLLLKTFISLLNKISFLYLHILTLNILFNYLQNLNIICKYIHDLVIFKF